MAFSSTQLLDRLDALYETWSHLSKSSSPSDLQSFVDFFSPECETNIKSMREPSRHGKDALMSALKEFLAVEKIDQIRTMTQAVGPDGLTVYREMRNIIDILGSKMEMPETVVVVFNQEGLIERLMVYSCRSHIVRVVQEVTSKGPYSKEEMDRKE